MAHRATQARKGNPDKVEARASRFTGPAGSVRPRSAGNAVCAEVSTTEEPDRFSPRRSFGNAREWFTWGGGGDTPSRSASGEASKLTLRRGAGGRYTRRREESRRCAEWPLMAQVCRNRQEGNSGHGECGSMKKRIAINASEAPGRSTPSTYPEPFASRMAGRDKRPLGDLFGLVNFGVNRTRLAPKAVSALRHAHSKQDEFIYVLAGYPTLITSDGDMRLSPGMCAGFRAGTGNACHLVNETEGDVVLLEIGDRTPGDEVVYPDDDLQAIMIDGKWRFYRKDGTPY